MNSVNDKLNNAELLVNFTRKGVGLTLEGSLITDAWTDKQSGERRTNTRIKMSAMTLAPKSSNAQPAVQTSTTVASDKVAPLWGGKTAEENDPWNVTSGLPDLPGQYGAAPELEEAPF
jgi:single-stranded DNA-binding protein